LSTLRLKKSYRVSSPSDGDDVVRANTGCHLPQQNKNRGATESLFLVEYYANQEV